MAVQSAVRLMQQAKQMQFQNVVAKTCLCRAGCGSLGSEGKQAVASSKSGGAEGGSRATLHLGSALCTINPCLD